jgi:hypothetical protein
MSEAREPVHVRTLTMEARRAGDALLEVTGRLIDQRPQRPGIGWFGAVSIARGFTRAVNERFGRALGCAHLTALIQAMAPVVRQAIGPAFREYEEIPKGGGETWFVNTCQAWKEGGLLHQRLAAGDLDGLKALSARAPRGTPGS